MSYKKFTRHHGKTSRVRKYVWSNPDHSYIDSDYRHRGTNVPTTAIRVSADITVPDRNGHGSWRWGGRHCGKMNVNRQPRRIMNAQLRIWFTA